MFFQYVSVTWNSNPVSQYPFSPSQFHVVCKFIRDVLWSIIQVANETLNETGPGPDSYSPKLDRKMLLDQSLNFDGAPLIITLSILLSS